MKMISFDSKDGAVWVNPKQIEGVEYYPKIVNAETGKVEHEEKVVLVMSSDHRYLLLHPLIEVIGAVEAEE